MVPHYSDLLARQSSNSNAPIVRAWRTSTSTALARQSTATGAQIDRLVYDFRGLTEDETRIVEGGEN